MQTSPLIVALDVPTIDVAEQWITRLRPWVSIFKIGMQLFYAAGPTWVGALRKEGIDVFLDLKLHDIPQTVAKACETLLPLSPRFLTVHVSGGQAMLEAAQSVVSGSKTQLLGVTMLTSLDQVALKAVYPGLSQTPADWVSHLAKLAKTSGLTGLVCSAHENKRLREVLGHDFCLVNPGIRLADSDVQDQKRVMTPEAAMEAGANYLVMGRPILTAPNPEATVQSVVKAISDASGIPTA